MDKNKASPGGMQYKWSRELIRTRAAMQLTWQLLNRKKDCLQVRQSGALPSYDDFAGLNYLPRYGEQLWSHGVHPNLSSVCVGMCVGM